MASEPEPDLESYHAELTRQQIEYFEGRIPDLGRVLARHGDVFAAPAVEAAGRVLRTAPAGRRRRLAQRRLAALLEGRLEAATWPITREILEQRHRTTVLVGQRECDHRTALRLLSEQREPAPSDAARLLSSIENWLDLVGERRMRNVGVARDHGFSGMMAMWTESRGVDYGKVATAGARLLAETDSHYVEGLQRLVPAQPGRSPGWANILALWRAAHLDALFPVSTLIGAYRAVLLGLGIRPGRQEAVQCDFAPRPTRPLAARCFAVSIPLDVRVSAGAAAGYPLVASLLRATAVAQNFAHASPDLPVELRVGNDWGTVQLFAALFESISRCPRWLSEHYGLPPSHSVVDLIRTRRLLEARTLAAVAASTADVSGRPSLELLRAAWGVEAPPPLASAIEDPRLRAADWLRGTLAAVLLRERLRLQYGRAWYKSRAAGDLLRELWATGGEMNAEDLCAELSLGEPSVDAFVQDFLEGE